MKQISDVGLQPEVLHCSLKDLSHVDVSSKKGVFLAIVVDKHVRITAALLSAQFEGPQITSVVELVPASSL